MITSSFADSPSRLVMRADRSPGAVYENAETTRLRFVGGKRKHFPDNFLGESLVTHK